MACQFAVLARRPMPKSRASDVATYASLWVRLVDRPEALQARVAWSAPCAVVVAGADSTAASNEGS